MSRHFVVGVLVGVGRVGLPPLRQAHEDSGRLIAMAVTEAITVANLTRHTTRGTESVVAVWRAAVRQTRRGTATPDSVGELQHDQTPLPRR